jgi:Ubiquitin family
MSFLTTSDRFTIDPQYLGLQIFIKTLTGRKQALNFEPDNQVLLIKQSLQEKEGIQVDQIKLIHSGKQLADDKTLEYYNITAGATIHMV